LIGEACNGNLLLFVSETGKIYPSTGKLAITHGKLENHYSIMQDLWTGETYKEKGLKNNFHEVRNMSSWNFFTKDIKLVKHKLIH